MAQKSKSLIKTLKDFTALSIQNAPEFVQENLIEDIIQPLEKDNWIFKGYGSLGHKKHQVGIHVLIFESEDLNQENLKVRENRIPRWQDEGSTSFHYIYFGTLYYCITMPF